MRIMSFPRKRPSPLNLTAGAVPRWGRESIMIMFLWIPAFAGMTSAADPGGQDLCQKKYADYKDRIAKNPSDDEAWTEFRVCTVELKKWDEAIQVALQARQKNHDLPQPYLILGLAQMQQKNYERAVEHFDQTIALKSNQPLAYFQMGMAYLYLNEPGKAEQSAERAVELDPSNPSHYRQLAYAQLILGDFPAAETAAKKDIELDKDDLAGHKILAKIYAKEGNNVGMTTELALVKDAEAKYAAAHPELVKKPEPVPVKSQEEEEDEKKSKKEEDYQVIGDLIAQWNKMRDAALGGNIDQALLYYSDYLDTRDQYRDSFNKMGPDRMRTVFASFGELYDCEIVFASAHCKSVVTNAAGTSVLAKIRFERNPDHVWRIRSF
jgi:tetratricopeptide (TPR) repeat protein